MMGALLIVSACGAGGFWSLAEEQKKVRALEEFHRFIRMIGREMRNTQADLEQILVRAAESCPTLIEPGQTTDRPKLERRLKVALPKEAHRLVETLMGELGRSALESQLAHLQRCAEEAKELHHSCRGAHLERQKLVMSLSVLAGMLLAILLL